MSSSLARRKDGCAESKPGVVGKGDFTKLAMTMRASGDALVKSLGITKGMQVLDRGCSDGMTARPEARRGADVLGRGYRAKPRRALLICSGDRA